MAQFKDHQADEKHETRELLLNRLPQLKKRKPRLLTLPSNNFIFETMVLERYPNAIIDCMEIDRKLYNQTKDQLPIKVNYEFGDIFDKLQDNPDTYDFIWLDLCGNLSTSNMYNIISAVQTSLKKTCIFAFTLASAREQRTKIFTNMYNCTGQEFRYKVFPKMIVKLGRMFHPKLALKKLIKYKNTSNSVPMSLYLFQTF
jgi:hypothetical protein